MFACVVIHVFRDTDVVEAVLTHEVTLTLFPPLHSLKAVTGLIYSQRCFSDGVEAQTSAERIPDFN